MKPMSEDPEIQQIFETVEANKQTLDVELLRNFGVGGGCGSGVGDKGEPEAVGEIS
jgi:hypothetical protein